LKDLQILVLRSNKLSGSIPKEIGSLINLKEISLYSNQLTGQLPLEIGNLKNLVLLHLRYNQFSGSIPSEIENLTNLKELHLSNNKFSGQIPSQIGNLTKLSYLSLAGNQLSGKIPSEFGNLANIKELYLGLNQLTGAPSSLSLLRENEAKVVLLPNPMSDIPYDLFSSSPAAVFSPTNWTNLMTIPVSSKKLKRQISSSMMTAEELFKTCPLNNFKNREVVSGCIAGIYNMYCKDPSNLDKCQSAYNQVISQSYFAPLGVCAAWKSGPKGMECSKAINSFKVELSYITLTPSHAYDFVSTIFGSRTYAPCNSVRCNW